MEDSILPRILRWADMAGKKIMKARRQDIRIILLRVSCFCVMGCR